MKLILYISTARVFYNEKFEEN